MERIKELCYFVFKKKKIFTIGCCIYSIHFKIKVILNFPLENYVATFVFNVAALF